MKRVSGYQTTDGKIFPNDQKQQARDHQATLNVIEGLKTIGERIEDNAFYCDEIGGCAIVTGEQFASFVLANAEDIKKALAGKAIGAATEPAAPDTPAEPASEVVDGGVDALVTELGAAA